MFFSLNAKRRAPLNNQSLLKLRQIDHNIQSNSEISVGSKFKEITSIVKDVITYDIGELSNEVGEPSNDMDLIAPEPQMEEPVIETLSNVVVNNNETYEEEPSVKVPVPVHEEVSGDIKDKEVELNKKRRKKNVKK